MDWIKDFMPEPTFKKGMDFAYQAQIVSAWKYGMFTAGIKLADYKRPSLFHIL